jgi:hypothetical protein
VATDYIPRVWLKAFWGFDPLNEGYLGFTRPGDRDRFVDEAQPGDLVLIYGADAPETALKDRRQALGFLEIEPTPIADRDRLSAEGLKRKIANGWVDRWTFAVPVRRAWQVTRRIEVKHLAPHTYLPARARVIASRGELMTPEEAANSMKLPVVAVSVFGEAPVPSDNQAETPLQSVFKPSRGIEPTFGARRFEYEDGDHFLYMLQLDGDIASLLGRSAAVLNGHIVVKVGFSRDPVRRRDEHNAALPPAGRLKWNLKLTSRAFIDGRTAKLAEDSLKAEFHHRFESLGGEFFLGKESDLTSAFISAAAPAAFVITATKRTN